MSIFGKPILLALTIAFITIAVAVGIVMLRERIVFNIIGNVSIPGIQDQFTQESINEINLKLNITRPSGTIVFENITSIRLSEDTYIQFKAEPQSITGNLTIVMNGKAILSSPTQKYVVKMPCILSYNTQCIRILMLIPGYDEPMKVPRGEYNITLIISWDKAEGEGEINLKITLLQQ